MADNLLNTPLDADQAVDLYAASSIAVGTKIEVQNIGTTDVSLYSQAGTPLINDDGNQVIKRGEYMENDEGDLGAFAISPHSDGLLNVKVSL
jgi:hypothetical protein